VTAHEGHRPEGPRAAAWPLAAVAVLLAALLVLTVRYQLYDTNFYSTWEATALLAGDHPYRDFFEWGIPLQMGVSAVAQRLSGTRLGGEFAVQWSFVVAGFVIACHLARRLAGRWVPVVFAMAPALALVVATSTFHYPKLFFYPLAVWLAWRHLDMPGRTRAALLGVATAAAFLFRHDHGVYIAGLAAATFAVAWVRDGMHGRTSRVVAAVAAYSLAGLLTVTPWLVVVQSSEGLLPYLRARSQLYGLIAGEDLPYQRLLRVNPLRLLRDGETPAARPGVIALPWGTGLDAGRRAALEGQAGLRPLGPDEAGRTRYAVDNVFDARLWDLRGDLANPDSQAEGVNWRAIDLARHTFVLASIDTALSWLEAISMVIPVLSVLVAAGALFQSRRVGTMLPDDTWPLLLTGGFLALLDARLLRQPSYCLVVAPVTAVLAARLLAGSPHPGGRSPLRRTAHAVVALGMLFFTSVAVYAFARPTGLFAPLETVAESVASYRALVVTPPIEGTFSTAEVRRYDRAAWAAGESFRAVLLRYVHDCTTPSDRVLVTGSTPFQVGYLVERRIAGGHLFWRDGWRRDTAGEQASLRMLQEQAVPFAISTHDPVLSDFVKYPAIHAYLTQHYVALDGSQGELLIDRRRTPTGTFANLGFPCFRD
jgi:hypothetical protein